MTETPLLRGLKEGETVEVDEMLCELETDKVAIEVQVPLLENCGNYGNRGFSGSVKWGTSKNRCR